MVQFWVDDGSIAETDAERGYAHFVEHMLFRGTENFPDRQARHIWQQLGASFGSDSNATTDATETVYQLDLPRADQASLDTSLNIMAEMMSRARFQEILQIRLTLESMITLRAAGRITPAVIEAMADDHRDMCNAVTGGDASQYLAANRRFHIRLYECAGTVVMLPVIESMWMQVGPLLNQVFRCTEHAVPRADHHHNAVLRALRRQDGAAAAQAIWDDLSDAADSILASDWFKE